MNQALADIALNSMYRTCFKHSMVKHDHPLSEADKQTFANCFTRLLQAYKIVAPTIFRQLEEERREQEQADGGK
jgi:hypothetical protein